MNAKKGRKSELRRGRSTCEKSKETACFFGAQVKSERRVETWRKLVGEEGNGNGHPLKDKSNDSLLPLQSLDSKVYCFNIWERRLSLASQTHKSVICLHNRQKGIRL